MHLVKQKWSTWLVFFVAGMFFSGIANCAQLVVSHNSSDYDRIEFYKHSAETGQNDIQHGRCSDNIERRSPRYRCRECPAFHGGCKGGLCPECDCKKNGKPWVPFPPRR